MKKNDYCMVKPLSGEEYAQISGGYAPPTAEQMRNMDCWRMLSAGSFYVNTILLTNVNQYQYFLLICINRKLYEYEKNCI